MLRMLDRWLAGAALVALSAAGMPAGVLAQAGGVAGGAVPVAAQAGAPGLAGARAGPVRVEAVEVELVSETAAIVAGQPARLGLRIRHDPHWHTYWRNPGDSGLPTQIAFELPAGFRTADIQWPAPQRLFIAPLANYGYEDEIVLPVPLQVPAAVDGPGVRFAARASWLMCREVCIPGEAALALELPVRSGPAPASPFATLFEQADRRMPRRQLAARAFAEGETLSIGLPGRPAAVEFFPYREGLVHNAGEQVLHVTEAEGVGVRLTVRLTADGAKQVRAGGEALAAAAEGIVVVDGEPRELAVSPAGAAFPAGPEISRVAGAPQVPPQAQRGSLTLPESAGAPASSDGRPGSSMVGSLWLAAIFGAVGGLILNLMPCVFPVIGLKVLGFARHGSEGSAASRIGALAFATGVVVSFWLLAGVLLALRAAGEAAGWGFQLQSPLFVAAMALLFVAIALNFSGQYEIGLALTRLGRFDHGGAAQAAREAHPVQAGRQAHPVASSFGAGVLAVLVATPCTAPFMGSALGY
ncbi:MAG: hypothetical protein KJ011_20310, partial [Burkholderiaceae bacterium]|nr:hypothetical protein [Burkholderiaceae bacterium]